jgi:hypothetical protein
MENKAIQLLKKGRELIDPILESHGFHWESGWAGKSSGGYSDSGQYVKGNRKLELHFRYSLGLVTYHIEEISLTHEDYMRYAAGDNNVQYPGFSKDPLDAFKHLANDLEKYAQDFLCGAGNEFEAAANEAEERKKLSGFQRLSNK